MGEVMLGLQQAGYEVAANPEQADTIIIHTCGFIGAAKEESIDTILAAAEWRKQGKRLVVTGAWYNATSRICAKKSEIDAFMGTADLHRIVEVCDTVTAAPSSPLAAEGQVVSQWSRRSGLATRHTSTTPIPRACCRRRAIMPT